MKKRAESRSGMVITTIALDPKMHKRLALLSVEESKSINVLVREAVDALLKSRSSRKRKGEES